MLGRMAGYEKREVTWEDLLAHGETYKLGHEPRPIRLDEPSEFRFQTRLDGCPMFALAYMGRKRILPMLLLQVTEGFLILATVFLKNVAKGLERAAPVFFAQSGPDFLHGAPPTSACAAFIKESRMRFANARRLDRKSGCTLGLHGAPVQNAGPATPTGHSLRSARMGSIDAARRAGTNPATATAPARAKIATARLHGSYDFTR